MCIYIYRVRIYIYIYIYTPVYVYIYIYKDRSHYLLYRHPAAQGRVKRHGHGRKAVANEGEKAQVSLSLCGIRDLGG